MNTSFTVPENFMNAIHGLFQSEIVVVSLELELFDYLSKSGPQSAAEILGYLGFKSIQPVDFLDSLVTQGLLSRQDGIYRNTEEAEKFGVKTSPHYFGDYVLLCAGIKDNKWQQLKERLRGEDPSLDFQSKYATEERRTRYCRAMGQHCLLYKEPLAKVNLWAKVNNFTDVAGGAGAIGLEIVKHNPHLRGIVADLPQVEEYFNESVPGEFRERLTYQPLDFFKDTFPQSDCIILANIIHNWPDDVRVMLMQKAFDALPNDRESYLVILEYFFDDEKTSV